MLFFFCVDNVRLPVLAGAAGALGATYCPPYLAVDNAYNARPAAQTSAMASSRLVQILLFCFAFIQQYMKIIWEHWVSFESFCTI